MENYDLGFISDTDFFNHVKDTVIKYRFQIDLKKFKKNLVDPIKLTFDSKVYNKQINDVIENEIIRQMDKSNTNHIGYFHQNIFNYIGEGWSVPRLGYDVVNLDKNYFVEMKNKHNTMNSSSSQKTYMRMQNTLLNNSNATCMLLEIIAKNSQNIVDFSNYKEIDFVSGGFPCQAFSYAGHKLGFEDTRGTLFFEFARAITEIKPQVFLGENVRGLLNHDQGKTIKVIKSVVKELGYTLIEPRVLKAIFYRVPQKRERLFLVGIRNDLIQYANFTWPEPYFRIMTVADALKKGELYATDCPHSQGKSYPTRKREIFSMVPPGGCWVDLPDDIQREYMQRSYFLGGGKTGMARRLSWDAPSLTLTCSPAQKQTERCHPDETRPLSIREYARIQTFPDEWKFIGSVSSQYKQIGNAVPVNLAVAIGRKVVALLNSIVLNLEETKQKHTNSNF